MIESLMNFFQKTKEETKGETPEGICPNCWGEQEYDSTIRELYIDKQIDINNKEANYAFIQNFAVTHINGIRLIKGTSSLECPTCKLKLKH